MNGFAAFDVYRNRKGYFGPMGVVKTSRIKGAGNALLHHCLRDMKEIGYEYAIIGGAGPIEFYEKLAGLLSFLLYNLSNTGRGVFPKNFKIIREYCCNLIFIIGMIVLRAYFIHKKIDFKRS
ncbi:hypothetical protein NX021_05290 [Cytobacillus firmus]|nr:hypothetical protein [Cytobacillus firmus]